TLGAAWHLEEILADRPPRARTALAFGLAALTRPEGILFFAVTTLHLALVRLGQRRLRPSAADLRWLGTFALLVVPHFVWRRWYYGWWLPNTFYIKSSGVGGTWQQGGYYLWSVVEQFCLWVVPLIVAAGFAAQRTRSTRVLVGYAALTTGVFAVYVASMGGDFMGLFRFVMPVIPLVALVAASSLAAALSPLVRRAP